MRKGANGYARVVSIMVWGVALCALAGSVPLPQDSIAQANVSAHETDRELVLTWQGDETVEIRVSKVSIPWQSRISAKIRIAVFVTP